MLTYRKAHNLAGFYLVLIKKGFLTDCILLIPPAISALKHPPAIIALKHSEKKIDNNKTVACSLLDLSKAFDSIDHTYLKQ